MATRNADEHERAAAGLDFDFPFREKAASLGQAMAENGPEALFEEIENLLPEGLREQIKNFPLVAMVVGVGVGVFLGMKKSEEVIAAGTSLVTAAAMANISQVFNRSDDDRD
ncbi:MAG: hypothetical protein ACXV7D_01970 [Thermoanaerobaculia bacterium]